MNDPKFVLGVGFLSAIFFVFTTSVVVDLIGGELFEGGSIYSAFIGGLAFGIMLALLKDRGRTP